MSRMEKIKQKIIKKNNLDSIEKAEELIKKHLEKMNYTQLLTTLEYVQEQQIRKGVTDANTIFIKLTKEMIDSREKEISENAKN